jgi:phosphoribosylformylglycinamidine synthase
MKSAVIVFPGSNCDRDVAVALQQVTGTAPEMVWHGGSELPKVDLIVLPGGFSYGDYLRSGAMASHSPVMREVIQRAKAGTPTLGICNGFQVLTESGLLPGVLMRNAGLKFLCKDVWLRVENTRSIFTSKYGDGEIIRIPVAHGEGNYFADPATLKTLEDNGQVAFRYVTRDGEVSEAGNPNGSQNNIAGIFNERGNVLGMMPHPERLAETALGGIDGRRMFEGLVAAL